MSAESEHRSYPYFFTWSAQQDKRPVQLLGGRGATFYTEVGEVLDLGSLTYQVNLGHGHPAMVAAVKAQAERLCVSMPQAVYPEKNALAESLLSRAGAAYSKVFFCLGGSDANEHALKIARLYSGRHKVISRYRSYHGSSMGAISLTGDWRRPPVEPGMFGVIHVLDQDAKPADGRLSFIPRTLELEQQVAAVFLEPVVGGNGVLIPEAGYFQEVQQATRAAGALLVVDEVLTGFGRTGKWFGHEHFEVEPDLITLGKALTGGYGALGAVLVHQRVAEFFEDSPLVSGLTHYAHPLGIAAALQAQQVYEDEGLVERAAVLGEELQQHLQILAAGFEETGEVRSIGLLGAIDLCLSTAQWQVLRDHFWEERVHVHSNPQVGAIIVAPPLCITADELADGVERVRRALAHTLK